MSPSSTSSTAIRPDFINMNDTSTGAADDHSGCVILFYNYPVHQLEVPLTQVFGGAYIENLGAW